MAASSLAAELYQSLDRDGVAIVPGVLGANEVERVRAALARATDRAAARGLLGRDGGGVDPNDRNVRVMELLGVDPVFAEMFVHPVALELVRAAIGDHPLLSSFTSNMALPGSGSMRLHSDLMAVLPEPWLACYGVNVLIYLHDTDEENGATRYMPGSHHRTSGADARDDDYSHTIPIEAPAGSMIAVDGRLWHTSGANRSVDRERAVLITFYVSDFIRRQTNWNATLDDATRNVLSPRQRELLGLDSGNMRVRLNYMALAGNSPEVDAFARLRK